MIRTTAFIVSAFVLLSVQIGAQTDVAGEWAVTFSTPSGPVEFTMYVAQAGPRLSGRLTSDAGEFPMRGSIEGSDVRITWSLPDSGRLTEITFEAKVEGDQMTGIAKLAGRGQGPMSAQRTGQ